MAAEYVSVSTKLSKSELNALLRSKSGPVGQDLKRRAQRVKNMARRNAPVDQGRLKGSIDFEMRVESGLLVARVGSNLDYAIYVEKGTGIYAGRGYIKPKSGTYLRWPSSGPGSANRFKGGKTARYVFAKRVKGQKAQPYLKPALRAARL
jgi:hypothetical protein